MLIEIQAPYAQSQHADLSFYPVSFVFSGSTGGALLISGGLMLGGFSSFIANEAGVGGLAIESFGEVEIEWEDFGMVLVNNSFHCPLGQYSFDADVNVSRIGATPVSASSQTSGCDWYIRTDHGTLHGAWNDEPFLKGLLLLVCAFAAGFSCCDTCRRSKIFAHELGKPTLHPLVL